MGGGGGWGGGGGGGGGGSAKKTPFPLRIISHFNHGYTIFILMDY